MMSKTNNYLLRKIYTKIFANITVTIYLCVKLTQ